VAERRKLVILGEKRSWRLLGKVLYHGKSWSLLMRLWDRHDFYQTPTTVIASFFLKKINKEAAVVEFSPTELSVNLPTTDATPKRYKAVIPLFAAIDTEKSTYKIMGTKLEVSFVKADGSSWPVLRSDEQRTGEIIQVGRAGRAV
jgi:hypothetical protein